jgi:hypothetical protein
MREPSDSTESAGPGGENGPSGNADASGEGEAVAPASGGDEAAVTAPDGDEAAEVVLAEVIPGVAVVCGEVPAELRPELVDFGIVPAADRARISAALAAIGNAGTVAGNLGNAFANVQGLYRISAATQALLKSGATLAVKDGANLGTVMLPGRIVAQARFLPVETVGMAQTVASIGPALAMVGLQMQLNEVTGLVRTNIALTNQVLASIRNEQWAELTGLVATIDRAVALARRVEAVPASLWDGVAGSEESLRKQLDLYRRNVRGHVKEIDRADASHRREYLQTNAEAIVFDTFALMDSLKAWTGYKALQAGKARAAGDADADEARFAEAVARETRTEFDEALAEATNLVGSLTRELRVIVELSAPSALSQSLTGKRKDAKAARETSARLLEAIAPLADALRPPAPPLGTPGVLCAPESVNPEPYLRVLRWVLEDGETLRVLGFPDQLDALGPISALLGGAKDKLAAVLDKGGPNALVAVTDRRVITARASAFLEQGEVRQSVPVDQVRYVRVATGRDGGARSAIDLVTRDESVRWVFRAGTDPGQVDALAAVLAESMTVPDAERDALLRRRPAPVEAIGS